MSIETQGMKFVVDTTALARGTAQYESAINGVFDSLDKFEKKVGKTMAAVAKSMNGNKASVDRFAAQFKSFGNIDIDAKAASKITTLSAAMKGFKAPAAAQTTNAAKFFKTLGAMPDLSAAYKAAKGIDSLSNTMANFKAPSKTNVANVAAMANAVRKFDFSNLSRASSFTNFLSSIGSFRAPSAASVRNLQEFVTTVGNLKVPPNAAAVATHLNQIATAANNANARLGNFRGNLGALNAPLGNVARGTRTATVNMMGLQNAFSGTFQIGSALRTMFGALTIGEVSRSFFEASNAALSFKAQMSVLSKETGFADSQLRYVNDTARKLGIDMLSAEQGFAKLSIAADKSGVSVKDTRGIFEGFSTAMTVLGTSTERQGDVFLAMQQILNKGYLSSEELNQQLNEHLPGAMQYAGEMAKKLGVTLEDALKKKMISATDYLIYASKRMREDFGPAMAEALKKPGVQMTILRGNVASLYQTIGQGGANQGFAELLGRFNSYLKPENVERFGKAIGEKLFSALHKAGDAIEYLYKNWDKIKGPLATTLKLLGQWMVVSGALNIGKALVTPLWAAMDAAKAAIPFLTQTLTLTRALGSANAAASINAAGGPVLSAGFVTALKVAEKFKAVMLSIPGVPFFTGIARGISTLAGPLMTVGSLAASAAAIVGTGLALAFGAGAKAAADSGVKMQSDQYSTAEIIKGFWLTAIDKLSSAWKTGTSYIGDLFVSLKDTIVWAIGGASGFVSEAFLLMTFGAKTAVDVIIGFFKALFNSVMNTVSSLGTIASKIGNGDFSGAASEGISLMTGKAVEDGFKQGFANVKFGAAEYSKFKKNVGTGFASLVDPTLTAMGKRGRGRPAAPAPKPAALVDTALGHKGQDQGDPIIKAKKKKKGPDPIKQAEALQDKMRRALDNITKKYAEDNPVFKVTQDFMSDLMGQADDLLDTKAYASWFSNLTTGSVETGQALSSLIDKVKGLGDQDALLQALEKTYGINKKQLISMLEEEGSAYARNLELKKQEMTFGYELIKNMKAESEMLKLSNKDQEVASKLIEAVNDARQKKIAFTQKDIEATRLQIEAQQKLNETLGKQRTLFENNGIRTYLNGTQQVAEVVQALDHDTFQGLEDTLYNLGMTGKLSFKSMLDSIQSDLMKWASQGVTKQLMGMFMPGAEASAKANGSPSLFGGMFKKLTGTDANNAKQFDNPETRYGQFGEGNKWNVDMAGNLGVVLTNPTELVPDYGKGQGAAGLMNKVVGGAVGGVESLAKGAYNVFKPVFDAAGAVIGYTKDQMVGGLMGAAGGIGINQPLVGSGAPSTALQGTGSIVGNLTTPGVGTAGIGAMGGKGDPAVTAATAAVSSSFKDTMVGMMPMIGMAFSSTFKSPIAQIGGMFLTMLLTKMMQGSASGGAGGGAGGILGGLSKIFAHSEGTANTSGRQVGASYAMHPSSFAGAPHYKDGTGNTSGGIPAVLHPNEAVIPLSRGRKVPVEIAGGGSGGGGNGSRGSTVVNQNFNISTPNADSFRKSRGQVATEMHVAAGRMARRNNG